MKKIYFMLLACMFAAITNAQVSNYSFAPSSGTYTALAGATNVYTGAWDDNAAVSVPIGFSFTFNGVAYTSVFVHPNGYLTFGTSTSGYTPISGGSAVAGVISAWGRDLQSQNTVPLGSVDYLSTGGVFTVQWSNTRRYNSTTVNAERFEMQIKLNQTTNVIEFVYGAWSDAVSAVTTNVGEVGLRGTSGTDFNNLSVLTGGNWASPAAGAVNTATVFYNQSSVATKPASGQTYTYSPPPPCVMPANQPTSLILTPSTGSISGTFTAAAGAPSGYLVVRTPNSTPPSAPVDATTYTPGATALGGVIVASGAATNFVSGGLTPATTYYYWAYSYNNTACSGGPAYRPTAPLSGSQTTLVCNPLAAGTYSVGPTGTYASLNAVATALADGASGPVIFELQTTYNSSVETFPITFPATPCTVTGGAIVRPVTGAVGLSITSANATATIDVNGANYLTIDGRPGGTGTTSQLTISNTATGTAVALRFINDASNNTVTYCNILGSTSTTNGVVTFSTGITTGNDGNTISNNNISVAGANFPLNGIFSLGTSAAIDNSGNTITGNNISDYFSAASSTNGININSNNSAWTISNNRLFQTATRLYTTANTHFGINITSGSGYTITGNVIGFADAAGTGTTNLVGNSVALTGTFPSSYTTTGTANATRYVAINCAFTAAGTVSNIQNNTIAGFALFTSSGAATTNGILCGIAVTSGNVNIGTTVGNTIGATTGNASIYTACTTSGGMVAGIYVSSANTVNIQNNSIGAINAMGTTASICGAINGINIAGTTTSVNISGNTIGNSTNPNLRMGNLTTGANLSNVGSTFGIATGTAIFNGILSSLTGGGTTIGTAALPNTIRNASLNSSSTTASIRGITSSGSPVISNNAINNITSACANITTASTLLGGMGIFLNSISATGAVVRNNTINDLSLTNTTATGTNLTGIAIYAGTTDLYANKIYNLINASTSVAVGTPGTATGFFLRQPAGIISIYNNMVSLGNAQTTNTAFAGIWQQNSVVAYTLNAYFNSINIEGVAASGAQPSFGLYRGSFSVTQVVTPVSILNNIFTNTRSGGTGKHYAIANNYGAAATATGWGANASNYNVLNATAATVGFWGTDQTFAGWQTASASDANSLSAVAINYVNTAIGDLHISGIPTPIEGAGTPIASVPLDYDGEVRSTLSPTDIGADAGNFINYPVINYTPLISACSGGARTLVATITDPDGVPTAGIGLPVLYWRINAGAYAAATATSLGSGQYQFSFGAGAVTGDVVYYYIVAQDNLGNVGSSPSAGAGGFTINPPAAATPPTTPNSYAILPSLSGTYTVGAAGVYSTLTAAVAAYNTSCLTGPVIFSLIDATYPSETYPITINSNVFASAVNTLTIRPAAGNVCVISGSNANTLIKLSGADYVTIDGLNTGGSSLRINNTNAAGLSMIWIASAGTDGATNNNIKNCSIAGFSSTGTVGGIIGGSGAVLGNPADAPNSNNTIEGCAFTTAQNGIYISGNTAALDQGWIINQNTFGSAVVAEKHGFRGLSVQWVNNFAISNNTINGVVTATTSTSTGISTFNIATNGNIFNNKISDIKNTNATGFGANGIGLQGTSTTSNLNVYNNFISDIAGAGFNGTAIGDNGYGIILATGGGYNLYYNTVVMNTNQTAAAGLPAALNVTSGITTANTLNIRNNIFVNTQTVGGQRYAVFSGAAASVYADINYNDYYVTGPNLGNIGGVLRPNLAAWQTGTGKDANSLSVQPVFVSGTDFHLSNALGANWCLNGSGIVIPGITTDIDGDTRSTGVAPLGPDMGADEFIAVGDAAATPASQTIACGTAITTITYTGTGTTFNWTRDNVATVTGIAANGTGTISGALTNTTAAPITVTFTITPLNAGGCAGPSFTATVTVNPTPDAIATPPSQTICSGATITTIVLSSSTAGTTTYAWTRNNTGTVTGIASSGSGNISGSLTNTTAAPITVTFTITPTAGGCTGTAITATVLVNPTPIAVATPASQTICSGATITTIALTSGTTGTTYTWSRNNTGTVTGIAASGSGDISGALTNTTAAPITVTFTITPTANSCPGSAITATVLVNPTPNAVATPASQTICSGDAITTIVLSSGTSGTTYSWSRDNTGTVTGIAASGTGDISGNLTNTTAGPLTVTFTITPTANGCPGTPITATVLVNIRPTISGSVTQPTTCVSTDGAITLTLGGAPGPYTFAWTGTGVNPTSQNQTNLTVGNYNVTVTAANGCTASALFSLVGPGGCSVCPTVGSVATNPTLSTCTGQSTTITASGLANMGITYGITFKYSTTLLNDAYSGGTVIATIPNGGLTGGGTGATTSTSFASAGTYFIYAILSPVPVDPGCRPAAIVSLQVNPTPTITPGANPTVCAGTTSAPLPYTSTNTNIVSGSLYNQSGTVSSGVASQDFAAAQNAFDCQAADDFSVPAGQTWNVTQISVSGQGGGTPTSIHVTVHSNAGNLPGAVFASYPGITTFSGSPNYLITLPSTLVLPGGATYWVSVQLEMDAATQGQWFWNNIGIGSFVGSEYAWRNPPGGFGVGCTSYGPTSTCIGTPERNSLFGLIGTIAGASTYSIVWSGAALGQGFVNVSNAALPASPITLVVPAGAAPATYTGTITVSTPFGCSSTGQSFSVTVNPIPTVNAVANQTVCNNAATTAVTFTGTPAAGTVYNWTNNTTSIGLAASGTGNIASFTATNATTAPVTATITVTPSYTSGGTTCTGTPVSFTITVNPTATVNVVANQTVCNGASTTAVTFSSPTTGGTIVYNWTNNNTTIGLAASGSGNIAAFTATNATNAPVTATITVTPSYTNGTTCIGTPRTFTITVNPTATVNTVPNQTVCAGTSTTAVTFSSPTTGGTIVYNWTNNTPSIGLAASGSGNIPAFVATNAGPLTVTATITVTPSYTNGTTCPGTPMSFTITVIPTPTLDPPPPGNQTVCNGAPTAAVTLVSSAPGVYFTWTNNQPSIGLASLGSGSIPSFTAINTGTTPVVATVTVTPHNGPCTGANITFTITVNPTGNVNAVANQVLCNGATTTAVTFAGTVAGTTFSWTNNTTSIGLAASGTGNIAAFTAVNTTNAPVTATITVTPNTANGCVGAPRTFTITVNPTASMNAVGNQALCNNAVTAAVNFSSSTTGNPVTYAWTNNTTSIGLGASGTGNIPAFTAINTGTTAVTATITVTPTAAGCTGAPITFTITVNPTATVNAVTSQTLCTGASTTAISFSGGVAGSTFNWTNNTPSIGLAASGSGNIAAFVATNTGTTPVTATITVTPVSGNGCTGSPTSFTITVNPKVAISLLGNPSTLCLSDTAITLAATPAGWVWTGNGIVAGTNIFSPSAAGLGVHTLTYTVGAGCGGVATMNITVNDCPDRHNVLKGALKIYPNPNNGQFKIRFMTDLFNTVRIKVLKSNGQYVGDYEFTNLIFGSIIPMDLRRLPSGMYILEAYHGDDRASFQLIIQH